MISQNDLHADELAVRQQPFQPIGVSHAEGQLGRTRIVRQDRNDASWKREHHVTAQFHLAAGLVHAAEVGMHYLVERYR